jgi:integrase/recombinase XerD
MTALAPTLQAFFTDPLVRQRRASDHTITAYRDTIRMLLTFTADRHGVTPSRLDIEEPGGWCCPPGEPTGLRRHDLGRGDGWHRRRGR